MDGPKDSSTISKWVKKIRLLNQMFIVFMAKKLNYFSVAKFVQSRKRVHMIYFGTLCIME